MNEDLTTRLHACLDRQAEQTEIYDRAVKRLLAPWLINVRNPAPLSSPSASVPHGLVQPFRAQSGVSGKLLDALTARISQLRGYQVRLGLSDAQFARLHPGVGSAKSWRHLHLWQPR